MNHTPFTTIILFIIPFIFILGFMYPTPLMIFLLMMAIGLIVIVQTLTVLLHEEKDEAEVPVVNE